MISWQHVYYEKMVLTWKIKLTWLEIILIIPIIIIYNIVAMTWGDVRLNDVQTGIFSRWL